MKKAGVKEELQTLRKFWRQRLVSYRKEVRVIIQMVPFPIKMLFYSYLFLILAIGLSQDSAQ